MSMSVSDYRYLYEGITQDDDEFRKNIYELSKNAKLNDANNKILSEVELAQNRLTHAMIGIHPLYRREIEISGIMDYEHKVLRLFSEHEDVTYKFDDLDPAYVNFIESQKRINNIREKGILPLSSVALKLSDQMCKEEGIKTPDISNIDMHLPKRDFPYSRKILENAFAKNMVLVNHLKEEIEKYGLDQTFDINKGDLISYCQSKSFDYQFAHSVKELTEISQVAEGAEDFVNKI